MTRRAIIGCVMVLALGAAVYLVAVQLMGPPVVCVVNESAHSLSDLVVTTNGGEPGIR